MADTDLEPLAKKYVASLENLDRLLDYNVDNLRKYFVETNIGDVLRRDISRALSELKIPKAKHIKTQQDLNDLYVRIFILKVYRKLHNRLLKAT